MFSYIEKFLGGRKYFSFVVDEFTQQKNAYFELIKSYTTFISDISKYLLKMIRDLGGLLKYMPLKDMIKFCVIFSIWFVVLVYKQSFMLSYLNAKQYAIGASNPEAFLKATLMLIFLNQSVSVLLSVLSTIIESLIFSWHQNINNKIFEVFNRMDHFYNEEFEEGVSYTMNNLWRCFLELSHSILNLMLQFSDLWTSIAFLSGISPQIFIRFFMPLAVVFVMHGILQKVLTKSQNELIQTGQEYNDRTSQFFDANNKLMLVSYKNESYAIVDRLSGIQSLFKYRIMKFIIESRFFNAVLSILDDAQSYFTYSYLMAMVLLKKISFQNALSLTERIDQAYYQLRQISSTVYAFTTNGPTLSAAHEYLLRCDENNVSDKIKSPTDEDHVIEIKNLKFFSKSNVVSDEGHEVDDQSLWHIEALKIKKNDRILVKGKSGCGKSSFLLLLAGLIYQSSEYNRFYEGNLLVDSDSVSFKSQDNIVPFGKSGHDDWHCSKWCAWPDNNLSENDLQKLEAYVSSLFDVDEPVKFKEALPKELSGGQRRRLNAFQPLKGDHKKFLLLDEITNDMGPSNAVKYLEFLGNDESVTGYMLSSHIIREEDMKFFDKVIEFENGNVTVTEVNNPIARQQSGL